MYYLQIFYRSIISCFFFLLVVSCWISVVIASRAWPHLHMAWFEQIKIQNRCVINNMEYCFIFQSLLPWGSLYKPKSINNPFPKRRVIDVIVTRSLEKMDLLMTRYRAKLKDLVDIVRTKWFDNSIDLSYINHTKSWNDQWHAKSI